MFTADQLCYIVSFIGYSFKFNLKYKIQLNSNRSKFQSSEHTNISIVYMYVHTNMYLLVCAKQNNVKTKQKNLRQLNITFCLLPYDNDTFITFPLLKPYTPTLNTVNEQSYSQHFEEHNTHLQHKPQHTYDKMLKCIFQVYIFLRFIFFMVQPCLRIIPVFSSEPSHSNTIRT